MTYAWSQPAAVLSRQRLPKADNQVRSVSAKGFVREGSTFPGRTTSPPPQDYLTEPDRMQTDTRCHRTLAPPQKFRTIKRFAVADIVAISSPRSSTRVRIEKSAQLGPLCEPGRRVRADRLMQQSVRRPQIDRIANRANQGMEPNGGFDVESSADAASSWL